MLCLEGGAHDGMLAWEVDGDVGEATFDRSVRLIPLPEVLEETARMLDITSPATVRRVALLRQAEALLAL